MFYYFVWVRSAKYHGREPLTYCHQDRLAVGQIVLVGMLRESVLGMVSGATAKPRFVTKQIERIYELPPLPVHLVKTAQWMIEFYPAPLGMITQQLLPAELPDKRLVGGFTAITKAGMVNDNDNAQSLAAERLPAELAAALPPLTLDQVAALELMDQTNTYILHGQTGSGKTRLYIELALKAFNRGKSSIILTPEISLTTQLAANVQAVFGGAVVVVHSGQTPKQRQAAWLRCLQATADTPVVVIGARSALFSPLHNLGLIVIDESHEAAYKQEQSPAYVTSRVAGFMAPLCHASVILGSATPGLVDYYMAKQREKPIIRMAALALSDQKNDTKLESTYANNDNSRSITIVDMKDRGQFVRSRLISQPLLSAVSGALSRGEQSLLYLNRRGTARIVLCQSCGWQANCPHCDVPLTYHADSHQLRCHACEYHAPSPTSCPSCGHTDIIYKTAGTKAVVTEVERLFPGARVARFDTDNAKADRFEQQYQHVLDGGVDILVGTQLLAKGLDLPKLSTLGIVLADTSLYMPDYAAPERTYQLITQVLGRIGRGHVAGSAIIQTYHPEHPVLHSAINDDYATFSERELAERKQFLFPPYCYLLKLTCRRASSGSAQLAATKLKASLQANYQISKVRIEGPSPSFYERAGDKFAWQLIVKAFERSDLLKIISDLPANWSYDIDPVNLL